MIRSLKKLKAWSKKGAKKRKRDAPDGGTLTRSTSPHCCSCSCSSSAPPQFHSTAPPLPPWVDFEQHREAVPDPVPATPAALPPHGGEPSSSRWLLSPGHGPGISPLYASAPGAGIPSYQQYLVPDPAHGVPIAPPPTVEGDYGSAGCRGSGVEAWLHHCLHCCCCCCLGNGN